MSDPIFTGILGWSNKRPGVEFYRSWEDGRHARDTDGWGRLLADDIEEALKHAEGYAVIVIVASERGKPASLPGELTVDLLALDLPQRVREARRTVEEVQHLLYGEPGFGEPLWSRMVEAKLSLAHVASYYENSPGWEGVWEGMMADDEEGFG